MIARNPGNMARPADKDAAQFYWLSLLGIFAVALTIAASYALRAYGDTAYIVCALASGLVAIAATSVAERTNSARTMALILAVAMLLRGILLFMQPLLSDDIYRYVWDGMVQARGINPYRYVPADPALASMRDAAIYPHINRADYAVTIYPPTAQVFFLAATRFGENVTTMKGALLVCEGITAVVIMLLLRKLGQPATRLVAYAWHPLPMWQIANSGHVDALMTALMMLGIWLAVTARPVRGAAVVMLGALTKPFAVLALPPLWPPWNWKMPLVCAAVAAICYAPYLSVGAGVLGFLPGYWAEEGLYTGEQVWLLSIIRAAVGRLPGDFIVYAALAFATVTAMSLASAFRKSRTIETIIFDINGLLLASLLLLSPNYPWYFLVATPFVAIQGGAPSWILTIGASLLHAEVGGALFVPVIVRQSILYGGFLIACAYSVWHMRSPVKVRERVDHG
jgi:alpha-1,6-mannosyltransferase